MPENDKIDGMQKAEVLRAESEVLRAELGVAIRNMNVDEAETEAKTETEAESNAPFIIQSCEYVNPAGAPHLTVCIAVGRSGEVRMAVSDGGAPGAYKIVMDYE